MEFYKTFVRIPIIINNIIMRKPKFNKRSFSWRKLCTKRFESRKKLADGKKRIII